MTYRFYQQPYNLSKIQLLIITQEKLVQMLKDQEIIDKFKITHFQYSMEPTKNHFNQQEIQIDQIFDNLTENQEISQPKKQIVQKQIKKEEKSQNFNKNILEQIYELEQFLQLIKQQPTEGQTKKLENKYDEKQQILGQQILKYQDLLQVFKKQKDQQNNEYIEEYEIRLLKAKRLKQCYGFEKKINSKLFISDQGQKLLNLLNIQSRNINQIILDLNKKQMSNNTKLDFIKKKKNPSQVELQKFKDVYQNIIRLREIIIQPKLQQNCMQKEQKSLLVFTNKIKQIYSVQVDFSKSIQQHLKIANLNSLNKNVNYYLKNSQNEKRVEVSPHQAFQMIVGKQKYNKYFCQLQEYIEVKLDNNEVKQFKKGIDLDEILKKLRIRGKNYYFFSNFKEYTEEKADENLDLKQCEICNIRYIDKLIKSVLIPVKITFNQLVNYIEFEKANVQTRQTTFISRIKLYGTADYYLIQQNQSISSLLQTIPNQPMVQQIITEYKIHLKIEIISKNLNDIGMVIRSKDKISQLKQKFEKQCKIDKKLQKWSFGGVQMFNQRSFEDLQIFRCYVRIQVNEIKNLQYYGFETEDKIETHIYTSFYIQNDEEFQKQIEEGNFPDKDYQYSFRIKSLAKIFSCIKKHCRIKTGLNSIKSIVARSSKSCNLWMPASSQQQTMFSETYLLFNILNSSENDLIIQMCKTYKNSNPLPLKIKDLKGKQKNLAEVHYWICTKSITVTSLQIHSPVQGKSTFLNQMFNTQFQTKLKHPICRNTAFIKYDIYRNSRYLVDLIDVSTNSLNQQEKIQLCQYSNILIVHLHQKQFEITKKWIQTNCKDKPVFYVYRDSKSMKNQESYKNQMIRNRQENNQKHLHIPELSKNMIAYYQYKFGEISDCINKFIIEIEAKESTDKKWLLTQYFQKSNSRFSGYTKKLRNLEAQFSTIVDLSMLSAQNKVIENIKISDVILDLVDIQVFDDISNFMSKMKQFCRIQRSRNLSKFTEMLHNIKNIIELKNEQKIENKKLIIDIYFKNLQNIEKKNTTQKFIEGLNIYRDYQKQLTFEILQNIYKNYLKSQFDNIIEKRQFSIENFWRILLFFYSGNSEKRQNAQFNNIYQKIVNQAQKFFSIQFEKGKTIQLINGDTLEMPIKLFRSQQAKFIKKQVMVVGIVGGQSSGKSNLLNFLFGCDFVSSEGRCTSGVYCSYYEVSGQNIRGCNGILVLDTQGLFGNYERKGQQGKNFDNKLVLFLLKICDILIVNCRGDISKNIQDILELSFDSQLMRYEPGVKYPHFNIVLNMKTDSMSSQDTSQIQVLRERIVQTNQEMQKYISSDQSNSLPFAFSDKNSQKVQTYLSKIQSKSKIATKQFYQGTRNLSLNLVKIMGKRGSNFNARTLADIKEQMYSIWSMLIRLPILTKHMNRRIKAFDDQIQNFIYNLNNQVQEKFKVLNQQIPYIFLEIDPWMQTKEVDIYQYKTEVLMKFENQFINRSLETNNLAKIYKFQIESKLSSFQSNLRLEVIQKKYKLEFSQSHNRGIYDFNKRARLLRGQNLTEQKKNEQFKKCWQKYTEDIKKKIDPIKNSKQIFYKVQYYYNDQIKQIIQIRLSQCEYQQKNISANYKQYLQMKLTQLNQKLTYINPLQAIQIPPVIVISQKSTTDLTYNYFDMKIFFQPKPTRFNYYINCNLNQLINISAINIKTQFQMRNSQVILSFIELIKKDLHLFSATLNTQYLKDILIQAFQSKRQNNQNKLTKQIDSDKIKIMTITSRKNYVEKLFNEYIQHKSHNKQSKSRIIGDNTNLSKIQKEQKHTKDGKSNKQKQKQSENKAQFFPQQKSQNPKKHSHQDKNDQQYNQIQKESKGSKFNLISQRQIKEIYQQENKFYKPRSWFDDFFFPRFIKLIVTKMVNKCVERSSVLYYQTKNELRKSHIAQAFEELNTIGIYPKQYQLYKCVYIKICEFNAVQIQNQSQLHQKLNNMSNFIEFKRLKQCITSKKQESNLIISECIAYSNEFKIQIKQQFQKNKILSLYRDKESSFLNKEVKNRQLVDLVKIYIKFQRILFQINKSIQKIPEQVKIQDYTKQISIVIKEQVQQFNRDLKQISHAVSIEFKHLIHDLTKKLIWKKLEIQKLNQIRKMQYQLNEDQLQQKNIFFGILETDSKPISKSNAKIFIKAYKNFIEPYIIKQKELFLQQKHTQFQKKFTRNYLQQLIQIRMNNQNNEDNLYNYLRNPTQTINKYYSQQLEEFFNGLKTSFKSTTKTCINQFQLIVEDMNQKLIGAEIKWQVDVLFQDKFAHQMQKNQLGLYLRNIFIELLMKGQTITSTYKNNLFKIKEGVVFQILQGVNNSKNYKFLTKEHEFEIFNLAYFISFIENELKNLKNEIESISTFSLSQKELFIEKTKLTLCNATCPCCERLCDIDMRTDPHHSIHRIDSGHQMRAVKGMVVQKKVGSTFQNFASVLRCQDIPKKSTFEYYEKDYIWQQFVLQKKNEWSFQSTLQNKNKKLFQHIWNTCGKKICAQFTKKGKQMKYIPYNEGTIKFIQSNRQSWQYIFAIDGSGSMSGTNWTEQLNSLKEILASLQNQQDSNTASVFVFNDYCIPFITRQNPRKINVDQIKFPSGGTTPDPTFLKAAQIVRDMYRMNPRNVHFFYISDGGASHPTKGIQQLLDCRKDLNTINLKLQYTSILIGSCSYGRLCMQFINRQMGGRCEYVENASKLAQRVKEVLSN